jgi:Ca2+-binding EF-hand superfamily protein
MFFCYCRTFDLDGSGAIDKHELKTALGSFGKFSINLIL